MARRESTMLALGTPAPAFQLPDVVSGRTVSLESFADSKAVLVMFICRHCPYVQHVEKELSRLGRDYSGKGVGTVGISPNDINAYPDDAPPRLREQAGEADFNFPYCYDETQETAKAFGAACTPDFFLFDEKPCLVYRGQLDDSRPSNGIPVTGRDLRAAIDAVLAGRPVSTVQKPGVGCSIKWKPGNQPA